MKPCSGKLKVVSHPGHLQVGGLGQGNWTGSCDHLEDVWPLSQRASPEGKEFQEVSELKKPFG